MTTPSGEPWPFYVVIRKEDKRYTRHPTLMEAVREAERLCKKDKATFNVLRLEGRYDVAEVHVVWRDAGEDQI